MQIEMNVRRAKVIFRRLLAALRAGQYPYNIAPLPQDQIPEAIKKDSLRYAQFYFYACHFMRGALNSNTAMNQMVALWHRMPELFCPEVVATWEDEGRIKTALALALNYHLDEIAGFWLRNSQNLVRRWKGDPRLLFSGAKNGAAARRPVTNKKQKGKKPSHDLFEHDWGFEGFQGKMTSMLAYFLLHAKLIKELDIAPAVDFHLGRIMLSTEIVKVNWQIEKDGVRYDQLYTEGERLLEQFCADGEATTIEIGDALWMLSSVLCRKAPGNASVGRPKKRGGKDQNGDKIRPVSLKVDRHNTDHLVRYAQSCGRCPVEKFCSFNVPSGAYYVEGRFKLNKRVRLNPPPELFTELPDQPVPRRYKAGILQHKEGQQLSFDLDSPDPAPS